MTIIIVAVFAILGVTPAVSAAQHTIKPGDNLWNIARQYNTSVAHIKEINKLSNNKLDVGKKLEVPDNTKANKSTVATTVPLVSRNIRPTPPVVNGSPQYTQPEVTSSVQVSRGTVIRRTVVSNSFAYIGRPYRYGGMSPKGFDCSGFVGYIFKSCGISLPHNAARQYSNGTTVDKTALIAGDLVFFRTGGSKRINHVGIFIGNNRFIHSASKKGISINTLDSKYYRKCYAGAKRIIES
ncbi:MAG: NlpC/P60 family protein [Methylocystaceae bacterium]